MIMAINFADKKFIKAQKYNTKTAYKTGKVDEVIEYSPADIDSDFYDKYKHILEQPRGVGYWLWKPYIIKKSLERIKMGDYLFYADSGSYYFNKVDYLVNALNQSNQDIMPFELIHIEKKWSKRDAFVLMGCDSEEYVNTNQFLAGFILIKKSDFSVKFVDEYLKYATDERILTDLPNTQGLDNYEGFIENRHDQTVFSLLCKKYKLKGFRDLSQYGPSPSWKEVVNSISNANYHSSYYPTIMMLYRREKLYRFKIKHGNFIVKESIKNLLYRLMQ